MYEEGETNIDVPTVMAFNRVFNLPLDTALYYSSAEFLNVYNTITPNIEDHHKERYDEMLTYYDETVADSICLRIDDILCKYFDTNCDLTHIEHYPELIARVCWVL